MHLKHVSKKEDNTIVWTCLERPSLLLFIFTEEVLLDDTYELSRIFDACHPKQRNTVCHRKNTSNLYPTIEDPPEPEVLSAFFCFPETVE